MNIDEYSVHLVHFKFILLKAFLVVAKMIHFTFELFIALPSNNFINISDFLDDCFSTMI